MGSVFDFIGTVNGAWAVTRVMFPQALIGSWPIENAFGYIWMTLFILVFYEHFLDDEKHPRLSRGHSKVFIFLLLVNFLVFLIHFTNPNNLVFSYFYLKAGFAAILFPIIFAFKNPQIIKKFAPLAFFFFFVWLVVEFVGVSGDNWLFTPSGQFVGSVDLLGVVFPFEEVFFWFMWYPAVVVAYYEYFVDDRR